jgi:hypothetical protein
MAPEASGNLVERHKPLDLRPRLVLAVGLGTLGFLVVSLGAIWLFQAWMGLSEARFTPVQPFPEPHLQSDPAGERRAYQAAQRGRLEGYAWADKERGLVRIPVSRAMAMIAARGAAAYEPLEPARWPDPRRR